MTDFTFKTVPDIVVEDGAAQRLAALLADRFVSTGRHGAVTGSAPRRVLIVSDPGIAACGLLAPVADALTAGGFAVTPFTGVGADPDEAQVLAATDAGRRAGADIVVGFGGGSSMDVAKLAACLIAGDQPLSAMYGVGNAVGPRLPLVQVPTTAGTGSEVTPIAIVTTGKTTKMGVVAPVLYADLAVIDAALTLGLPRAQTAATGIDAMVHAIEAYTSARLKNPVSDALAVRALALLADAIGTACDKGGDLSARRDMLLGAMMAGQAFANAPVAAVHALAYPLGGHFHVCHGLSNSLVLPHVLRFNMPAAQSSYGELAVAAGLTGDSTAARAGALVDWLAGLPAALGIESRLRDVGVAQDAVPLLAADAMLQTRLLVNNPREVSEGDARAIYEAAW